MKFDFFPTNRALCLSAKDDDSTETKIDDMVVKVDALIVKQQKEARDPGPGPLPLRWPWPGPVFGLRS